MSFLRGALGRTRISSVAYKEVLFYECFFLLLFVISLLGVQNPLRDRSNEETKISDGIMIPVDISDGNVIM